ncbi:hypothetical protein GALMADRAFT_138852 [Galerina marginata CBS 339.88]|uniref:Uncharacterized protein n=1 Tax=Galerina marginata (strain CBS 339.88) TaxID=685588 RepID=A0A067TFN8_GALM3|nr:hypothetical protein GALMADRAFT_138852 [Galerina marginata CBS 339.88]
MIDVALINVLVGQIRPRAMVITAAADVEAYGVANRVKYPFLIGGPMGILTPPSPASVRSRGSGGMSAGTAVSGGSTMPHNPNNTDSWYDLFSGTKANSNSNSGGPVFGERYGAFQVGSGPGAVSACLGTG